MPIRIISAVFEHQEPTKPSAHNRVTINLAVDDTEDDAAVMERLALIRDSVRDVLLYPPLIGGVKERFEDPHIFQDVPPASEFSNTPYRRPKF